MGNAEEKTHKSAMAAKGKLFVELLTNRNLRRDYVLHAQQIRDQSIDGSAEEYEAKAFALQPVISELEVKLYGEVRTIF